MSERAAFAPVGAPARELLPSAAEWQTMAQMAEALYRSGMLPAHIKSPQAALAVIQKGRELGIPPMYALSNIVVVNGKPTCNAELMLALIYRDQGSHAVRFAVATAEIATIAYRRRDWSDAQQFSFSMDEAKRAGLLTNQTWQKYPAAMLRARAISAVARMAFPDSIAGMYTAEELGATVEIEDGDAVIVASHDGGTRAAHPSTGEVIDQQPAPRQLQAASTPAQSGQAPEITPAHVALYGRLAFVMGAFNEAVPPLDEWNEPGEIAAFIADMIAHILPTKAELPEATAKNRAAVEEWRAHFGDRGLHLPELPARLSRDGARWLYDTYAAVGADIRPATAEEEDPLP